MTLGQIQDLLKAEILTTNADLTSEISHIKASDLMSDVLTGPVHGALLITGLVNAQAVRTAEVVDLSAIVFARGKKPSADTIELAQESSIPLLATSLPMYEACGILYSHGAQGSE